MILSPAGRQALMMREGVRLRAYRDVRGIWTIGVGHTSMAGAPRVWPWSTISSAMADTIFVNDVRPYEAAVAKALHQPVTQNAFDACVSLCYNIGAGGFVGSSVVKSINAGKLVEAADDFLLFDHPASLIGRRREERAQFLKGI